MIEQAKIQTKTNRPLLILSMILLIIGVTLSVASAIPTTDSTVWFDQSFQVQGLGYCSVWATFYDFSSDDMLNIHFDLSGEGVVNFYVMTEADFTKYESGQTFEYYTAPSAESVAVKNTYWSPPNNQMIYFVWDNSDSFSSQTIDAIIKIEDQIQLFSPIISFIGHLILFCGLSLTCIGYRPPTADSSRSKIIAGYVFAVLGGVIGLIIGIELFEKRKEEDKSHGKNILAIGGLAILLYLSSYFLW